MRYVTFFRLVALFAALSACLSTTISGALSCLTIVALAYIAHEQTNDLARQRALEERHDQRLRHIIGLKDSTISAQKEHIVLLEHRLKAWEPREVAELHEKGHWPS